MIFAAGAYRKQNIARRLLAMALLIAIAVLPSHAYSATAFQQKHPTAISCLIGQKPSVNSVAYNTSVAAINTNDLVAAIQFYKAALIYYNTSIAVKLAVIRKTNNTSTHTNVFFPVKVIPYSSDDEVSFL